MHLFSKIRNVCIQMSGFVRVTLHSFQIEPPKMKLCEFVRVPRVSDWARFAVQISKGEALMPWLTVGLLFIFMQLSCVHLTALKMDSVSQTPPNFEQKTSVKVVHNSRNKATSVVRFPSCLHKLGCQCDWSRVGQ